MILWYQVEDGSFPFYDAFGSYLTRATINNIVLFIRFWGVVIHSAANIQNKII